MTKKNSLNEHYEDNESRFLKYTSKFCSVKLKTTYQEHFRVSSSIKQDQLKQTMLRLALEKSIRRIERENFVLQQHRGKSTENCIYVRSAEGSVDQFQFQDTCYSQIYQGVEPVACTAQKTSEQIKN